MDKVVEQSLKNSYTYLEYRKLVSDLSEKGESTGPLQTEELAQYTELNNSRMRRWDKTLKFNEEAVAKIKSIKQKVVVSTWGPRSINATKLVEAYKAEHGKLSPEFKQDLQVFYNKDKGQSVLEDLLQLLPLK